MVFKHLKDKIYSSKGIKQIKRVCPQNLKLLPGFMSMKVLKIYRNIMK